MKNIYFPLFFLLSSCGYHVIGHAQKLKVRSEREGVLVTEGKEKVFFFQRQTKSLDGEYARCNYIHPLYGLDGSVLTEDFPADHPHHRGVFWTWHRLFVGDKQLGDAWACENFLWDVQEITHHSNEVGRLVLDVRTTWSSPVYTDASNNPVPTVSEKSTITIHPRSDHYRIIDFGIELLALLPKVQIAGSDDEKGYGGFSIRTKLPEDLVFSAKSGKITPITNQIVAGPWMNISGSLTGADTNSGILLISHPDNPTYPEPWILRNKNSMQNIVYPGRDPVSLAEETPTILKYRLVIYEDTLTVEEINHLTQDYF